ncbi:cardiolipin synthase [Marinisporobacter balticus]|uniref:Cardiolipin synthase n=1 Tax=Marinisporobacter balticus TaxID=2018667 RepID=A0A4V2SAK9_9FIRM|nr:cardiolipin synthase [Marinisporobacter balticus]TCO71390.1 cardiolipin synthase [Marinisporobacter balticus]
MRQNHKYSVWICIILILFLFTLQVNAISIEKLSPTKGALFKISPFTNIFLLEGFSIQLMSLKKYIGTVFTIYTFFIALLISMENKNPSKTIAWILILVLIPIVGFILYLFMGQNVRKKKIFKNKETRDFPYFEQIANIQKEAIKDNALFKDSESFVKKRLIHLILNSAKTPFTVNNQLNVLTNGNETFASIITSLKSARHHIHLEYFIIKEDHIGTIIKNLLMKKAREGIEVRVIYDSVGSWRLSKNYLQEMQNSGVEIHAFSPVVFPLLSRKLNYRNHRKIIVIDGKIGFLGGLNIGDEYLGKDPNLGFWRDSHLKVEGEAVYGVQNIFLMDWLFVSKQEIDFNHFYFPKLSYYGEQLIQITASGPYSDWESIMQAYFSTISSAEDRIWINTPYLVPGESIMMALKTAALSGVDVRIILPDKPDHQTVFWASMSNVEELLEAGVKVYRYKKGFIHAKVLLVDGVAASVGTANLDIRSFQINFEINAFIYEPSIIEDLERNFLIDVADSEEIQLEFYLKRPLLNKVKESISRLFSPLL